MRIRLLSLATLLFAASFAQAQDLSELRCRYTKGEVFEFKLQSVIDREPRREARLAGTITVGEADKAYTKAEMVLTDLYAIKSGSGSGASANASKLKDFKLDIRLFPTGRSSSTAMTSISSIKSSPMSAKTSPSATTSRACSSNSPRAAKGTAGTPPSMVSPTK